MTQVRSNRSLSLWPLLAVLLVLPACDTPEPEAQAGAEAPTAADQAAAANEELARQYIEAYDQQDRAALEEILADSLTVGDEEMARSDFLNLVESYWAAFPDFQWVEPRFIGAENHVTVLGEFQATGQGEFLGHDVDGQEVRVSETIVFGVRDGQLYEYAYDWDELGFWVQLGVLEDPLAP